MDTSFLTVPEKNSAEPPHNLPKHSVNQEHPIKESLLKNKEKSSEKSCDATFSEPVQQMMPGFETPSDDIIDLLNKHHVRYIDKRYSGGSLWILGGHELDSLVAEARGMGFKFHYKPEGGRATKNKAGWWGK